MTKLVDMMCKSLIAVIEHSFGYSLHVMLVVETMISIIS